jgi:hypothetical protein
VAGEAVSMVTLYRVTFAEAWRCWRCSELVVVGSTGLTAEHSDGGEPEHYCGPCGAVLLGLADEVDVLSDRRGSMSA